MLQLLESTHTICALFDANLGTVWTNLAYKRMGMVNSKNLLSANLPTKETPVRQFKLALGGQPWQATAQLLPGPDTHGYFLTAAPGVDSLEMPEEGSQLTEREFLSYAHVQAASEQYYTILVVKISGLKTDTREASSAVKALASRLIRSSTRAYDKYVYLGAGKYEVILPKCSSISAVHRIGRQMLATATMLMDEMPTHLKELHPRVDIGASISRKHKAPLEVTISEALNALKLAATSNTSEFYLWSAR